MKKFILMFLVFVCLLSSASFASDEVLIADEIDLLVSTRGYTVTAEEFFGDGWRMTRSPIISDKVFTTLSPTEQMIRSTVLYVLGKIPGMSDAIYFSEINGIIQTAQTAGVNGIYSKTYYLAKPVNTSLQSANIPVACYVKYVTIFYETGSHRITNYLTSVEKMEVPNVQNIAWYRLASPNTNWIQ